MPDMIFRPAVSHIRCLLMDEPLTFAARAGMVLFLLCAPFLACVSSPQRGPGGHHSGPQVDAESERRDKAMTSSSGDGGTPPRDLIVPPKPDPWMKMPPCNPGMDEHPINGACWQGTSRRPPCGELYRFNGGCYRPLLAPKKEPVSGQ